MKTGSVLIEVVYLVPFSFNSFSKGHWHYGVTLANLKNKTIFLKVEDVRSSVEPCRHTCYLIHTHPKYLFMG